MKGLPLTVNKDPANPITMYYEIKPWITNQEDCLMLKKMYVSAIGVDRDSQQPVVVLKDEENRRILPIWIGNAEARAISQAMLKIKPPRPGTHDLMLSMVESLGFKVKEVIIEAIESQAFRATIKLEAADKPGQEVEIDARASDAIALALRAESTISVAAEVLQTASVAADPEQEEKESADFKDFLGKLKASDFAAVANNSGEGEETEEDE
ncbi:MAG TPA: bifunctional nuclease family protein [Candidatus Obscuribacter sp.]|nr:bifunctional nuclease family protein [Candidatus Obscuribacter sp.]HND69035.1 bifunctional nuclease family protein [Candidatus Obscuribacter sp.]HNG20512.1 bifunctional nuclease family protein [Candidatus Obscuribacter sp.]HNG74279.1 bifunctional nuclease family protein [Candidatus Obscuribacter sp.]HNH76739.1 bifunctional nuclease family protein [Candidatus Obscuribacter sp.]